MIMIASLTMTNELYAQGNSGKDKPERDKPERDKPERDKPEKKTHEKNIKAENAQKNWGHLKKELKDEEGRYNEDELKKFFGLEELSKPIGDYTDKEIKEAIKAEKIVRKELWKNEDPLLKSLPEGANQEDLTILIEGLVDDYLYRDTEEVEKDLENLIEKGFDKKSLTRMTRANKKYKKRLGVSEEDFEKVE